VAVVEQGQSLAAHVDRRDKPGAPGAWKVRKKRIDTVSFADLPDLAWGGGAFHARIGWEASRYRLGGGGGSTGAEVDDQPAAVLDLVKFSADGAIAEHAHDHEWESIALFEGEGTLVEKAPTGEVRIEAHPGTLMTIPAGVRHAWKPSGKAPLVAIQ